jgi:hypothetical protein
VNIHQLGEKGELIRDIVIIVHAGNYSCKVRRMHKIELELKKQLKVRDDLCGLFWLIVVQKIMIACQMFLYFYF